MNPAREFLGFDPTRQQALIEEAATRRGLNPVLIEKDFWVCWLLSVLFDDTELAPHLVFKGGTSLSKVFNVIDRFSEDVDLSVSPAFVGADIKAYEEAPSRTKRAEIGQEIQARCGEMVERRLRPQLEAKIADYLGSPLKSDTWLTYENNTQSQCPSLLFNYPSAARRQLPYVRSSVLLELGSITDQQPVGKYKISPWIAETIPDVFKDWGCEVTALELPRTFWEKATILHSEYHRPLEKQMPDRYARHYYDFTRMASHSDAATFMADKEMAIRVALWKAKFFPRMWGQYETAAHGTFKLVPAERRLAALEQDYTSMQPLFLKTSPTFKGLLEELAAVESKLNAM